jgi:hypothetical protein
MSSHPTITTAIAQQHRRDLTARAEAYRLAHAARDSGPAPAARAADPAGIIRQLITGMRRAAIRLRLLRVLPAPHQPRFPAGFAGGLSPAQPIPVQQPVPAPGAGPGRDRPRGASGPVGLP